MRNGMFFVASGILIFAGILLAGCVSSAQGLGGSPGGSPGGSLSTPPTTAPAPEEKTFTLSEIAGYSTKENCLIAINGSVYNITGYFGKHPAGDRTLLSGCGKDATGIFSEKHSQTAWQLLPSFYAGKLAGQ
ncbi:MAG: cytochrome b5-like heme/steroid binding domain-containing protein [archaeon]